MEDARSLLHQSNNLDAEDFCDKVHALSSTLGKPESAIVDKKYNLNDRYQLAYEVLYSFLHKSRSYGVNEKEEKSELMVVKQKEKEDETPIVIITSKNNYYALLGVDENATQKDIDLAFKRRTKDLQADTLESILKKQGFSDEEIKIRIEQVKREYENFREAYDAVGNEKSRKYYDEFRKKYQKGEKTSYQSTTELARHARNWEVLEVGAYPTQIEVQDSYRRLAKKYHPDAYLAELGKKRENLTPEELKELNLRESRLYEINEAYRQEFNRQLYQKEKEEREKTEAEDTNKESVLIETKPTLPKSDLSKSELKKVQEYQETVNLAGPINLTPEETTELKSYNLLPDETTPRETSANITTAVNLRAKGVKAKKFSDAIDTAVNTNVLTPEDGTSLQGAAFFMEAFEKDDPELSDSLFNANQEPDISISPVSEIPQVPQPNQFFLQKQEGEESPLQPMLDTALEKGKGFVEEKAEKAVVTTLEKKGVATAAKTTAQSAGKKIALESLKKGGKELVTKVGSKIAVKAGLSAVAAAASGGTSLLIQLGLELAQKLLSFVKKAFTKILQFITGKDDLKSQVKELAGFAFAFFLATGMVLPALLSGGLFLASTGIGSIIGGLTGFLSVVTFAVATIIISISWPVILATIVFFFLVVFSTFIINNSAFLIPEGGFGYIGGTSSVFSMPGAIIGRCNTEEAGADITNEIASRIDRGVVNLLPTEANTNPWCILPTMIILHSSGGYDNDDGCLRTYETLITRNLACQLASDTDDVWVMQPFYEKMVTMAWCANSWNAYGISIEVSGEKDPPNPAYVICSPYDNIIFSDPPPHPCDPETDLSFSAVCEAMQQYNIPWCQVYQHEDVPNCDKLDPLGNEWVEMFIDRLKRDCPTGNDNQC